MLFRNPMFLLSFDLTAEKIIISKEDTIIMGGAGEKADIDERVS